MENEFDKQINDWMYGIGETRTVLAGTWRHFLNIACADTGWTCLASWQVDDFIHFTVEDDNGWHTNVLIEACKVSQLNAVRTLASLQYQAKNPKPHGVKEGHNPVPDNVVQYEMWLECWQQTGDVALAQANYIELGGQFESEAS